MVGTTPIGRGRSRWSWRSSAREGTTRTALAGGRDWLVLGDEAAQFGRALEALLLGREALGLDVGHVGAQRLADQPPDLGVAAGGPGAGGRFRGGGPARPGGQHPGLAPPPRARPP